MSSPPAIEVRGVSMAYKLAHDQAGTLKEYTIRFLKRQITYEPLWAVRDVTFDVAQGEVLGIIGPNGAGKTTLMMVVAGVLPPTEGRVITRGRLSPLIALGAGFNDEMTAYENIVKYGTLLGRDPAHMHERVRPILAWAELEGYLDVPIRSLSSGMRARLSFAVATDIDPDILIVDEVLAVGDEAFRDKSMGRMQELMDGGSSVLLVSHNLDPVEELAHRVLWLHHGEVVADGDPADVIRGYRETARAGAAPRRARP
ncbi:MAG TPA: ABC transporter ATP-binding protein [Nitriliruptorales bacterium]